MTEAEKLVWEQAAQEIREWIALQKRVFSECPTIEPKETWREHCNQVSQLGVLLASFRKKAGHDPKDIFEELKTLPKHSDYDKRKP